MNHKQLRYRERYREIQLDLIDCHQRLDGIVPRRNNGEEYTLLKRLDLLIAAIAHNGLPADEVVAVYRKSRSCPACHSPIKSIEDEEDLDIPSEITDPPMYPGACDADAFETKYPDNNAYWGLNC